MNSTQKKFVEVWCVIIILFLVLGIFQNEPLISRLAFFPVLIYLAINYKELKNIKQPKAGSNLIDIINQSKFFKMFGILYIIIVISIAYYFLITGKNLGDYFNDFLSLFILFTAPLLVPFIIWQIRLFQDLGKKQEN